MKKRLKVIGFLGVVIFAWVIMGLASAHKAAKPVSEVRVIMREESGNFFLDPASVKGLMEKSAGGKIEGRRMGEVSVTSIEQDLDHNPWVGNAEVYRKGDSILCAEITLRRPVARVIDRNGISFYLDRDFRKFPVSEKYPANVPLIRGDFTESIEPADSLKAPGLNGVVPFLKQMNGNEFFQAFVSEIVVASDGEMTLYPELGDLKISFGKAERAKEKMDAFLTFANRVLARTGWGRYESVDLRFAGQIVAKKRFNWL